MCPAALIPLPCPALVLQTYGPRFNVLLSSYETVLKDKTELKKLQFEVNRNARVAGFSAALVIAVICTCVPGSLPPLLVTELCVNVNVTVLGIGMYKCVAV